MSSSHRIQTVFTTNESHPSKMAAQLFQIAVYDRNGCFEMNVFKDGSEEDVRQLLAADRCHNIQLFSVQLDDNPLVMAFRLLEQDGSYGPQFMEMELGSHLLNRTDGKGVEMYVQLLDDLTASVMCRGTETTQTSGTKALKDVFYDLSVPLSNQGAITVELGNILALDGSPTEEVSRDENDCSDTDSQEEVFDDAVDQLSSYDELDLPEESETEVFYDCYEDLSEDQAVDGLAMAAQLFLVAKGDRNGCKEIHGFSNMSEDEVKQLFSADGDENIQLFSVQLDDISDENPLVLEFHQLQEDGSLAPEFMKMELGSDFLDQIHGRGVEIQRNCGGTENTQTSSPTDSSDTLKDVFNDTEAQTSLSTKPELAGESCSQIDSYGNDCLISFHKKLEFFRSKESPRAETSRKEDHREDLTDGVWLDTLPVVSDLSSSSFSSCEANEDTAICSSQIEPESVEEALHETEAQTSLSTKPKLAVESCAQIDSYGNDCLISFHKKLEFFRSKESPRAETSRKEDHREDLTDGVWLDTLPVVSDLSSSSFSSCEANEDTAICSSQIDSIEPESVEETRPVVYESSSEDENDDEQLKSFLVVADVHTYNRTKDPCRSQIESSGRISLHETKRKRLQGCVSYLPDVITEDPAPSSQSEEEVVGKKKKEKKGPSFLQ